MLSDGDLDVVARAELGNLCDLIVVVGGDGSLLGVARDLAHTQVPVVGINRGGLGFLAGIPPDRVEDMLGAILAGDYLLENHFLLQAELNRAGATVAQSLALNDVVVHPGSLARMIEFNVSINEEFVYQQRSDGLIVASPTGSTAYALSAGGPIMHPSLDALVIVPMFPHTLTSRPLVVEGNSEIEVVLTDIGDTSPQVSCDSQVVTPVRVGDQIIIKKAKVPLKLLYPKEHSFFESCRNKLDWASRLGQANLSSN